MITHVCLETHGSVCEWDGDKLTAWVSTQGVHQCAQGFAQALGIPQTNVRVITQYMGGGFGSKFAPDAQGLICAKLAKIAKAAGEADARSQGRASRHRQSSVGVRAHPGRRQQRRHAHGVRRAELGHRRRGRRARTSRCRTSISSRTGAARTTTSTSTPGTQRAMRAPGHPQGCFLTEILMDELADRVKMDPVEFRIKNCAEDRAERDVGRVLPARREAVRLGQAASDRRSDAGADQDRHGRVGAPVGRRRPRLAGAHRHHVGRQRRREVRHAGHRHRHAHDRRDGRGRNARPADQRRQAGDRRHAATRSAAGPAAARPPRRSRRRFA